MLFSLNMSGLENLLLVDILLQTSVLFRIRLLLWTSVLLGNLQERVCLLLMQGYTSLLLSTTFWQDGFLQTNLVPTLLDIKKSVTLVVMYYWTRLRQLGGMRLANNTIIRYNRCRRCVEAKNRPDNEQAMQANETIQYKC